MADQEPMPGYVRCDAAHIEADWQFEVLDEPQRVGLVTIMTGDGPLHIGVNRIDAERLVRKLQLFLLDWPEDRADS